MTESCARPGCGHDARRHNGLGCLYAVASEMPPAGFCSCPAYRTPEQQEAWERLEVLAADRDDRATPADLVLASRRLLELYP